MSRWDLELELVTTWLSLAVTLCHKDGFFSILNNKNNLFLLNIGQFRMKQTQMHVCTLEEFILNSM